ncbi:phospholipase A, partial [Salmonella enterica]
NTGYGGAEVGLSYPVTKHVRLYTQVYSGYGESLIDYNFNQTRVGVGVMLNDIF